MEIGSEAHIKLLRQQILKTAFKTASIGFIIGIALMLPSLLRENAFSISLFYLGAGTMLTLFIFAIFVGIKKQRAIKQSLAKINAELP